MVLDMAEHTVRSLVDLHTDDTHALVGTVGQGFAHPATFKVSI